MKARSISRTLILGAVVAASGVAVGCSLGGDDSDKAGGGEGPEPVVLTLANPAQREDLDEFVREVASLSDGSMRIEVEEGWREGEIDFERGTIEDVREGKVDLGSVGARALDLVGTNSLQPILAPFAVDSYALEREVLASPLAAEMLAGVGRAGVIGISLLPGELRKPLGVSGPLVDPADYRGTTIGIRPSELSARTFEALGVASTQGYQLDGDVSSLDGLETHLTGISGARNDAAAGSVAVNVTLWPRTLAMVMNRDAYEALDDDQREILRAAGRAALDPALADIRAREKEAMGILCKRPGLAIRSATRSQLAALRAAAAPVTRALKRDPATRHAVREIEAMRSEVEPEPAPACAPEDGARAGAATPVEGLWRMDTTRAEAAEVVQAADLVPENFGEFLFAFKDGRFAFTTESAGACIWAYGTYSVDDEVVEWRIEDGGGDSPNHALNVPGEVFRYDWSRYRDQLELAPIEGEVSPEPFRVEPWRQLDGEVSLEPLSDRCPPPADALEP